MGLSPRGGPVIYLAQSGANSESVAEWLSAVGCGPAVARRPLWLQRKSFEQGAAMQRSLLSLVLVVVCTLCQAPLAPTTATLSGTESDQARGTAPTPHVALST